MTYRPYNPEKDMDSILRVWQECGWVDMSREKEFKDAFFQFSNSADVDVVEFNGSAECFVVTCAGRIQMLEKKIPLCIVAGVTTGIVLRRMGAASRLTGRVLARSASDGAAAAALGMFDQGYYNKLGFGNFPYHREVSFDPLSLMVPPLKRPPLRLSVKELSLVMENLRKRRSHHGQVHVEDENFFRMILDGWDSHLGFGFQDENGELSHHLWGRFKGENGPVEIEFLVYRDFGGLMELLSFIKSLGDQFNVVKMQEPPGIQIQDILARPFRMREMVSGGKYRNEMTAASWQQLRILNMENVLAGVVLPSGRVQFNLELSDPLADVLEPDSQWKGLGGNWVIRMTDDGSSAAKGREEGLPLLRSSVNAFSRLVFGAASASALAATDNLEASPDLLAQIDRKLRLPLPNMELQF